MSQHYPTSCVEVSAWCNVCAKMTPHRVAAKHLQYCLTCYDKPKPPAPDPRPAPAEQIKLF